MTVKAKTGDVGDGKSYSTVIDDILPAAQAGFEVWTNIPLRLENWPKHLGNKGVLPKQFKTEDIKNHPDWFHEVLPKGVLLVLDECDHLWPAGMNQRMMDSKHREFLKEHRHLVNEKGVSTNIILITQSTTLLASCVKIFVKQHSIVFKVEELGLSNVYKIERYRKCQNEQYPRADAFISDSEHTFKTEYFELYISHTKSDAKEAGADELSTLKRETIYTRKFKIQVGLSFMLIGYFAYYFISFFTQGEDDLIQTAQAVPVEPEIKHIEKTVEKVIENEVEPVKEPEPKEPPKPKYSDTWTIVGSMTGAEGEALHGGTNWLTGASNEVDHVDMLILSNGNQYRKLKAEDCDIYIDDYHCEVDGELVTEWTGRQVKGSISPL